MCPMCVTTAAMIAAGTASAGGLLAFAAAKLVPATKRAKPAARTDGEQDGTPANRLPR